MTLGGSMVRGMQYYCSSTNKLINPQPNMLSYASAVINVLLLFHLNQSDPLLESYLCPPDIACPVGQLVSSSNAGESVTVIYGF